MGKTGMFGSWIRERRQTEVSDSAEALHFACVEQPRDDRIFFAFERDEPMDGIT